MHLQDNKKKKKKKKKLTLLIHAQVHDGNKGIMTLIFT